MAITWYVFYTQKRRAREGESVHSERNTSHTLHICTQGVNSNAVSLWNLNYIETIFTKELIKKNTHTKQNEKYFASLFNVNPFSACHCACVTYDQFELDTRFVSFYASAMARRTKITVMNNYHWCLLCALDWYEMVSNVIFFMFVKTGNRLEIKCTCRNENENEKWIWIRALNWLSAQQLSFFDSDWAVDCVC